MISSPLILVKYKLGNLLTRLCLSFIYTLWFYCFPLYLFALHQRLFKSHGGVIKDGEKVIGITPGPVVTVTTASGAYQAKKLVITAGPWANTLLSHTGLELPLQVQPEHNLHNTWPHSLSVRFGTCAHTHTHTRVIA